MSYYNQSQQQQQYNPPVEPGQGYPNQYAAHSQNQQSANNQNPPPNGTDQSTSYQYPGQQYDSHGVVNGPVSQPQGHYSSAYTSPHLGSLPGNFWQPQQQQSYPSSLATYNPQHYAPVGQQSQTSQYSPAQNYNPQAYASPPQSAYAPSPQVGTFPDQRPYASTSYSDQYGQSPALSSGEYMSQAGSSPQIPQQSPLLPYRPQLPPRLQNFATQTSAPPARQYSYSTSSTAPQLPPLPYRPAAPRSPPLPTPLQRTTPYPTDDRWVPSPPQYYLPDNQDSAQIYQTTTRTSIPSPNLSTPGPTPPAHGLPPHLNTSPRHPQARPLPGPPELEPGTDYFEQSTLDSRFSHTNESSLNQDDLFNEVEDAFVSAGAQSQNRRSPRNSLTQGLYVSSHAQNRMNGHLSPPIPARDHVTDDSDVEAAQGLEMMRAAEEEDQRRRSGNDQSRFTSLPTQPDYQHESSRRAPTSSDSDDFGNVDMSSFGGGYDVQMSYGGDPATLAAGSDVVGDLRNTTEPSTQNSIRRSHASRSSRGRQSFSAEMNYAYQQGLSGARVDARGTGGLSEPTGRRQSFDEGDEEFSVEAQLPERFPDEPPDISFNAASTSFLSGRPLPPRPTLETALATEKKPSRPGSTMYEPGHVPDVYIGYGPGDSLVPRSSSFVSHSNTPTVAQPSRSKTDAEERTRKQQQMQQQPQQMSNLNQMRGSTYSPFDSVSGGGGVLDLPPLGAKRFVPSKLGAPDFKKCAEPWGLSAIMKWLLTIISPEQYAELKEVDISDALVNLFTNKVPTMNIADAEGLAHRVVQDMYQAGTLVATEEWVKLVPGTMSGVIFQLTGSGCYAPNLHEHIMPGRCYSHFCQRTLKKLSLNDRARGSTDWAQFYNLERSEWETKDKKELERQYILHEIVHTEDSYIDQLSVLQSLYRDPLGKVEPSIISPSRRDKFITDVFGRLDAVKQANLDHLLPQLKYRQQEQGPWICGFSDIFRQWIRKAKAGYLEYAGGFPGANFLVRNEIERNLEFRTFMDRASKDPRSMRLGWDTYLKAPITRLQRYSLLLSTVLKNMQIENEERRNLQTALEEIKTVTHECDMRVAEMARKVDLTDLGMKLKLRPGMQNAVELNLDHFGREIIYRGDLQRMGGNRFTWLDSHAILFDHYLVIAKTITQNSEQGGKVEKYDVSRLPIPMDLLILESTNDGAVQKSSYMKGITSVSTVSTGRVASPAESSTLGRISTNPAPSPGGLQHANTGASSNSLQTVTSIDVRDSDRIMYPFKVKHLGRDTYTLFAPNETARNDWVTKITEAKTKHAASLYAQNAEPFKLRVMADSAFVYDAYAQSGRGVAPFIRGTPIYRAVKEVEHRFKDVGKPGPICRARVNCATTFTTPYPSGQIVAVGTDFGIFLSEIDNPRGWTKAISMSRVTQIAVLEEFNLFLLIADKSLIAYHLDVICPSDRNGPTPVIDSARKAPQKLSGSKDVGFFSCGRMKDRTLVLYKKRENLASVFKVLEPIYQKSTEKRRGMFKRGTTDFFREYDEFYIPAESSGINLFHSSLAVSTARGFEVLTLDKKQPWSIPELRAEHVQNIASHIKDQKALGMLRLSDQEFLLCYSNCAVYVNKHGDVSRSVIMDFVGTAQNVALYGVYLVLFDNDFVEIRNASNGRLKQIISGREIKCLDDGGNWSSALPTQSAFTNANTVLKETAVNGASGANHNGGGSRTVKFVMQHPESEKTQLVMELILNENMKE